MPFSIINLTIEGILLPMEYDMSILKKLSEARVRLQESNLKKSGDNTFSKYSYFELKDFLPTINNLFKELGMCGVVSFTEELATLTIYDTEDNSTITFTSPMSSANLKGCHPVQNIGAVETYQRRYLYMNALEIVESDILDKTHDKNKPIENEESQTRKRGSLVKAVEESAKKGTKAMGEFWKSLSVEDCNLIGEKEKQRIYQIAKGIDNGTAN